VESEKGGPFGPPFLFSASFREVYSEGASPSGYLMAMLKRVRSSAILARKSLWCVAMIAFGGAIGVVCVSQAQQAKGGKSALQKEKLIRRLPPSAFTALAPEIIEKLEERGCTIPQFDPAGDASGVVLEPTNVIRGEFARQGQEDWAVLCSKGGSSTILIFWQKPTPCVGQLARLEDAHYLQSQRDKTMRYSRSIQASGETDLHGRFAGSSVSHMSHQGIEDRFVGKSSSFFYCSEGKWKIFPGAD
jgi:hypothetical protein